ncbi:MAG: glycosyltransferase family 2 protein [Pelagibacterales bacterium]|nr:glycosyltransferase family 2 protein [Pelagibacterales bacterium]
MKVTVIIPVYNEAPTINEILKKVNTKKKNFKIEIIISDDCSTDLTRELLHNHENFYDQIFFGEKNRGKGFAIGSVQKMVTGDIVIIQDADLEYDPNDYKNLIQPILDKKTKVVYGSRVLGKNRYEIKNFLSFWRVFFNHLLTIISNIINKQNLTDAHTCYKVFTTDVFKSLNIDEKGFGFCPEVTSQVAKLNLDIVEIPISYQGRSTAQGKKINISDGFRALYVLLKYKFKK